MTFESLNLKPGIIKALNESGYSEPTPIQMKAIPQILDGADIRATAQTGTGKTAAFLLPAMNRLATPSEGKGKGPRILILAPTRELAMQIATQSQKYSQYLPKVRTVCVCGGMPYPPQKRKLSRPYDVLVATPGRLIDFLDQGLVNFSRVEMIVLDEADRMLDMGFVDPVEKIVSEAPDSRQTLLFSATLKGSVMKLSKRLLHDPVEIRIDSARETHENIEQVVHYVDDLSHKNRMLEHLLNQRGLTNAIIFTSTKRHADQLAFELKDLGHEATPLHGDMSQRHRSRAIRYLRDGKVSVLVATDVAARGIDVPTISHVINFDLPTVAEDYVHRIGRTGRAGATGVAISLVSQRDAPLLRDIQKYTGESIAVTEIEGLEPKPRKKSASKSKKNFKSKPKSKKKPFKPKGTFAKKKKFHKRHKQSAR